MHQLSAIRMDALASVSAGDSHVAQVQRENEATYKKDQENANIGHILRGGGFAASWHSVTACFRIIGALTHLS
jgi:hypothetical protein